jgi:hypothetical protein
VITTEVRRDKHGMSEDERTDFLNTVRYQLQVFSTLGIPCSDADIYKERLTMLMLLDAIDSDPVVRERSMTGEETLNIVCRMSLTEKAELRARVGKATQWLNIGHGGPGPQRGDRY